MRRALPNSRGRARGRAALAALLLLVGSGVSSASLQPAGAAASPKPTRPEAGKTEGVRAAVELARDGAGEAFLRAKLPELDAAELATRERATRELSRREDVTLAQVEHVLEGETISLEQRRRLESIGFEKFVRRPRPALGITFADQFAQRSVSIRGPVDGFDSARVLQPDDTFYAMGGVMIRAASDARQVIMSYVPGEWASIHLFRAGEPVLVHVRLGSYRDLPQPDFGANPRLNRADGEGPTMLRQAWAVRLARRTAERAVAPSQLELGVAPEQIALLDQGDRRRASTTPQRQQRGPRFVPQAVAPQAQGDDESSVPLVALGGVSGLVGEPDRMPYKPALDSGANEAEAQRIIQGIDVIDARIAQMEQEANAIVDKDRRRMLKERIQVMQTEREKLKMRLSK